MQPSSRKISDNDPTDETGKSPRRWDELPPEILDIIWPALQFGGLSGMSGILVGSLAGVIRSSSPTLFALVSGIQCFTLGSTFQASRQAVLNVWGKDKVTPRDKISASAMAGCVAGSAGGLLRGRGNVVPGAVMFTLFGAAGQTVYNLADARNSELAEETDRRKKYSWLDSKWSPMTVLSDNDYQQILRNKLLHVNAEIALVDESIAELRGQQYEMAAKESIDRSGMPRTK